MNQIKSSEYAIETLGLSYRYPSAAGFNYSIHTVDFKAGKGRIVALLGENGAGKTTLMKHFNGILDPTEGVVLVNGAEITKKNLKQVRRKVGMVFQNPDDQLFSPTVKQDVAFGPMNLGLKADAIEKRVAKALKQAGVADLSDKPPHELSTGEKKRVCFAGVLAMNPEILVLDEPTANLDPRGVSDIIGIIKDLNRNRGITVIMATHNVNLVPELAHEVYVMHKGHVLANGTPARIFQDEELLVKANLDLPDVAKLVVKLKKEGYDLDFALSMNEAYRTLKKLLDDGHA